MTSARWSTSTRRAELPPDWHRTRCRILERDPICCACHLMPPAEVDHIHDPHDHDDTNLQGLCTDCHKRKTQAEAQAARARKTRRRPQREQHPGLR